MPQVRITKPWWENIDHLRSPDFKDSDLDGGIKKEMFVLLKEDRDIVLEVDGKNKAGSSKENVLFPLKQRTTTVTMVRRRHPYPPANLGEFLRKYAGSNNQEVLKVKKELKIKLAQCWIIVLCPECYISIVNHLVD